MSNVSASMPRFFPMCIFPEQEQVPMFYVRLFPEIHYTIGNGYADQL